jgi:chromosome partitioning protein
MQTISLIGQKGGSGKTTLALGLAICAKQAGKTVVVIDLDPQTSATNWYDRREQLDEKLTIVSCQVARLKNVLQTAQQQGADLIIIDTPAKSSEAALEAARSCDLALVPIRPQIYDLETLQAVRGILDIAKTVHSYVIINSAPIQGKRHIEAQDIALSLGYQLAPVVIYTRAVHADAPTVGQTANEFEPTGKGAEELNQLYKFISKLLNKTKNKENDK